MGARRKILVADLLCGAGGSTTGAMRALLEMGFTEDQIEFVCVNHWPTAIETHTLNHPRARHYVQDIATGRPHLMVPEGYLDLLMASPTCTHHSNARGGKPTSDQQRSDPWHIITWLTELRVKRLIIENVWEFCKWGPIDTRTGRPIKSREGEYFWAWINALKALGFTNIEWRKLNAADYGDATTRQRFILMARSDGRRVTFPQPTHMKKPNAGLELFPTMKPWRAAREIIDWELRGRSIFDRPVPLAPKTLERIWAGAVKYGWPAQFLVILRNHMVAQGIDVPLPTITATGTHIGLAQVVVGSMKAGNVVHGVDHPAPSPTTQASLFTAQPIILSQHNSGAARSTEDPLPTITTGGAAAEGHPGCARPMIAEPLFMNGRRGNEAKPVSEAPIPTLDTKGAVWIAEPFVASVAHGTEAGDKNEGRRCHSIDDPLGTMHAGGGKFAVVEPFVLSQGSGGAPRSVEQPLPTIVTGGQQGSGTALISPYYGSGSGETCTSTDETLPTVTSKGRFGVVVPVTNSNGGPGPRSADDPLPTMTTAKGGEFAVVFPTTHVDKTENGSRVRDAGTEPLPTVTGANRGELAVAFIPAQFGERDGQAPRTHSVDEPTPTIAATGHVNLVEAIEGLEGFDILFRMLEPHELAAAMGFTTEDQRYEFAGTKTEKIKQIGNAVSVAKMKACVGAIMADAAPSRKEAPAPRRVKAA